jgi:hypothetical protein
MHKIYGLKVILPVNFGTILYKSYPIKKVKKYFPFGRVAFAHLLRYQGLAVPKVSFAPECPCKLDRTPDPMNQGVRLANERMRLVKYAG